MSKASGCAPRKQAFTKVRLSDLIFKKPAAVVANYAHYQPGLMTQLVSELA